MGGDLDDVVGGIGMGLGEVSDHDFVDASRVSSFQFPVFGVCGTRNRRLDTGKSCSTWFDEFPEDCSSWFKTVLKPQYRLGDLTRLGPGDTHHANAAAPWRRRDGDDCIVKIHRAIVAGYRATTFSISIFSWSYGRAPGWYRATLPVRSSNTNVGVVEAPYISKLYLLMGTGISSRPA